LKDIPQAAIALKIRYPLTLLEEISIQIFKDGFHARDKKQRRVTRS